MAVHVRSYRWEDFVARVLLALALLCAIAAS
jgi:hypothetical protein